MPESVPIKRWGKDHWSTLGYIECRVVDNGGTYPREVMLHDGPAGHMRNDGDRYPTVIAALDEEVEAAAATQTAGGVATIPSRDEVPGHDDWDCAVDLMREGLIALDPTSASITGGSMYQDITGEQMYQLLRLGNARWRLTEKGHEVAAALREHKANGGTFHTFRWSDA